MRIFAAVLILLAFASTVPGQIVTTEVWVGALDQRDGRFVVSDLKNISNHPGYDNQPAFFPDNERLVYTSEITDLSESGLGVQAFLVDLRTGERTPLPEARGFSPTPTADGRQLMMLREGRVWLHDLSGRLIRPLTETTTAGYYSRFDDRTYVLFMNEPERRIAIYDARRKTLDTRATGAMTAPYRIPGQRAVTFVAEEPFSAGQTAAEGAPPPERILRRLDLRTGGVTTLATIPFATGGHHVWTSRGTLLLASGPVIHEWSPSRPGEWTPIYRSEDPDLQGITRIAISPRGDRIALVSTPRDETIIREARTAFNQKLTIRPPDLARFYAADALMVSVFGERRQGRDAIVSGLAADMSGEVAYVRDLATIQVSDGRSVASERGTWSRRAATSGREGSIGGDYLTVWRRTSSASGTPVWAIENELLVALECAGTLCE
jgi:ketosteroid isomerase-like protein